MFKKMVALLTLTVMFVVCMSTTTFAWTSHQNWYILSTPNVDGSDVTLSAANKYYSGVLVNLDDKTKTVKLCLFKVEYNFWGTKKTTWYGNNQDVVYGEQNYTPWWHGDINNTANYCLKPETDAEHICISGSLENQQ